MKLTPGFDYVSSYKRILDVDADRSVSWRIQNSGLENSFAFYFYFHFQKLENWNILLDSFFHLLLIIAWNAFGNTSKYGRYCVCVAVVAVAVVVGHQLKNRNESRRVFSLSLSLLIEKPVRSKLLFHFRIVLLMFVFHFSLPCVPARLFKFCLSWKIWSKTFYWNLLVWTPCGYFFLWETQKVTFCSSFDFFLLAAGFVANVLCFSVDREIVFFFWLFGIELWQIGESQSFAFPSKQKLW